MTLAENTSKELYPSYCNALDHFLAQRKWKLQGQETIKEWIENGTFKEPNPYDIELEKNESILQKIAFLEENGLKGIAFYVDEGEASFIERVAGIENALIILGHTPSEPIKKDVLDQMAKDYVEKKIEGIVDYDRLSETFLNDLRINDKAEHIVYDAKPNIEKAILYVEEIVQYGDLYLKRKLWGEKDRPHVDARRSMLGSLKELQEKGVTDVGFEIDSKGFADLVWLDKYVRVIEKAVEAGQPIPPAPPRKVPAQGEENALKAVERLKDMFPALNDAEITPRLSLFIKDGKRLKFDGGMQIEVCDGSYVILDVNGKMAYPICFPNSRQGNAEDLTSILVNNIGWTKNDETGEKHIPASRFIAQTRVYKDRSPDVEEICKALGIKSCTRPTGVKNKSEYNNEMKP